MFDHLLAHIAPYGRMVGTHGSAARAGEEQATAAWAEAMKMFSVQVLLDYEKDTATQRELLGPYEAQLEQQRAVKRERNRKAAAAPKPATAPAANATPAPVTNATPAPAPANG